MKGLHEVLLCPAQASALAASVRGAASQMRRADVEAFLARHGASILAAVVALAVSLLLVGRSNQAGGLPLHSHPFLHGAARFQVRELEIRMLSHNASHRCHAAACSAAG